MTNPLRTHEEPILHSISDLLFDPKGEAIAKEYGSSLYSHGLPPSAATLSDEIGSAHTIEAEQERLLESAVMPKQMAQAHGRGSITPPMPLGQGADRYVDTISSAAEEWISYFSETAMSSHRAPHPSKNEKNRLLQSLHKTQASVAEKRAERPLTPQELLYVDTQASLREDIEEEERASTEGQVTKKEEELEAEESSWTRRLMEFGEQLWTMLFSWGTPSTVASEEAAASIQETISDMERGEQIAHPSHLPWRPQLQRKPSLEIKQEQFEKILAELNKLQQQLYNTAIETNEENQGSVDQRLLHAMRETYEKQQELLADQLMDAMNEEKLHQEWRRHLMQLTTEIHGGLEEKGKLQGYAGVFNVAMTTLTVATTVVIVAIAVASAAAAAANGALPAAMQAASMAANFVGGGALALQGVSGMANGWLEYKVGVEKSMLQLLQAYREESKGRMQEDLVNSIGQLIESSSSSTQAMLDYAKRQFETTRKMFG